MALGERIAALRIAKRQSLQDVADAVGVSKAHVWQMERGKADNPAMALVTRLADHFGVTVSYLVGEKIDAEDADAQLAGLFRQAQQLDARDRQVLYDMVQSLLKSKKSDV